MAVCCINVVLVINIVVVKSDGVWCVQLTVDMYLLAILGMIGDEWVVEGVPFWDRSFFVFWQGIIQCGVPRGWGWCLEDFFFIWLTNMVG